MEDDWLIKQQLEERKSCAAIIEAAEKEGMQLFGFPRNADSEIDMSLLQERLNNFRAARRGKYTWLLALASACASIISALAAWYAIYLSSN